MMADAPALPVGCSQLWATFSDLHGVRFSPYGASPISFRDMLDWQRFHGIELEGWEIDAIRKADNAYFASVAK